MILYVGGEEGRGGGLLGHRMTRAAIGPAIIVPCLGLALWAGVAAQDPSGQANPWPDQSYLGPG